MTGRERPTAPPGLDELRHDSVRLDWAERAAYRSLLEAIEAHPPAQDCYQRWLRIREERSTVEARISALEVPRG